MKSLFTSYFAGPLLIATMFSAVASDWPGWRGPAGQGVSPDKNLPVKWSTNENVRWRVALPERGNSSPIVWSNRVFVTQALSSENRRTLICFDRANGKQLWQSGPTYTEREQTQRDNPYCAATPVTDGERIIASFGSAGVYCYDFAGKELWHRDLGKMNHMFGNASSPILAGDLCILYFGPDQKSRLVALNKKSGEISWEVEPPKVDPSEQPVGGGGGFAGPGGPGGRGGFGPAQMIAPQMFSQGDKDKDGKLAKVEFSNLAEAWFDKLDKDKTGKLDQQTFTERFTEVLPPPQGANPPEGPSREEGQRPGGRGGGFGGGRFVGPGFFTAADIHKDSSLTREEFKTTFGKWFSDWDANKAGSLDENQLRDGLAAALPRPQFGGGGGPGGRGGPGGPGDAGGGGPGGSWSTSLLIKAGGREELIMNFPSRLASYDPKTGKQLWLSKGLGGTIYTTPIWGEGALVAISSGMGGGNAIAVKPGGTGDVTESHRLWKQDRFKSGIGSGVIHGAHLYTVSQDGIAECLDLKTGNKIWEERLKGPGNRNSTWSSTLLADGKIYVPNQSGDVFVLRASPKFEILGTNSVNEPTNGSLAAANDEIFLRTDKSLWCFSNGK